MSKATDDERREVASRLRLLEPSAFDDGEFYDIGEVLDALGVENDDGAWCEAAGVRRLADLIEPGEPEVKPTGKARDALLELRHAGGSGLIIVPRAAMTQSTQSFGHYHAVLRGPGSVI